MKKFRLWNAACHASLICAVAFLVLFALDRINPAMGFIGSDQGDWFLLIFCVAALLNGGITASYLFMLEKRAARREQEERGATVSAD